MSIQDRLKRLTPALSNVRGSFLCNETPMEQLLRSRQKTEGQRSDFSTINTESHKNSVEKTQLNVGTFVVVDGCELEFEIGQVLISEADPDKKTRRILVLWFEPLYDEAGPMNHNRTWCRHHRYNAQYRPRIFQKPSLPQVSRLDESSVLTTFAELTIDSRLPTRTQHDIHFALEKLLEASEF